jgi:hypothetical protein
MHSHSNCTVRCTAFPKISRKTLPSSSDLRDFVAVIDPSDSWQDRGPRRIDDPARRPGNAAKPSATHHEAMHLVHRTGSQRGDPRHRPRSIFGGTLLFLKYRCPRVFALVNMRIVFLGFGRRFM